MPATYIMLSPALKTPSCSRGVCVCVCVCVCVFCSATKSKQTKGGRSGKFVYDNVGNITNAKG